MGSSALKPALAQVGAGCAVAIGLMGVAAPAHADWVDRHGYLHYGPPPWAYAAPVYAPPPVYVAPPVYAPPVVVVGPRVWVPAHWWRGAWFPGHWR